MTDINELEADLIKFFEDWIIKDDNQKFAELHKVTEILKLLKDNLRFELAKINIDNTERLLQYQVRINQLYNELEAAKQWQREAVEAMKACREDDDGPYFYDTKMAALIKQAEGDET